MVCGLHKMYGLRYRCSDPTKAPMESATFWESDSCTLSEYRFYWTCDDFVIDNSFPNDGGCLPRHVCIVTMTALFIDGSWESSG